MDFVRPFEIYIQVFNFGNDTGASLGSQSEVKNLPANAGDVSLIPASRRSPEEGNGNPLQYFLPEKSLGQRNLAGYSPWSPKKSDTT